jgi:hypothetical protein
MIKISSKNEISPEKTFTQNENTIERFNLNNGILLV